MEENPSLKKLSKQQRVLQAVCSTASGSGSDSAQNRKTQKKLRKTKKAYGEKQGKLREAKKT